MDKSLYINMGGASNAMRELEVVTNNLANVNTTAFRGDSLSFSQFHVADKNMPTRTYGKVDHTVTNFDKGSMLNTGRDLDVALNGEGFIAVQSKSGKEGYTRSGAFEMQNGVLMTKAGELVMGNAGAINIPEAERLHISNDGTISAKFPNQPDFVTVDRIKLTKPDTANLQKGTDGLFYPKDGTTVAQDPSVSIITGTLEGSNVNAIRTMTQLIDLSRHYEIHTNFMKTTADNTSKANQILELSR